MAPRGLFALGAFAAALFSANGARMKRGKFLAGVPVLNYELVSEGKASLAEKAGKQKWIVVVDASASDEQVDALCKMSRCVREGHPSKGGMPYFEIAGTERDLEKVLKAAGKLAKFAEPDQHVQLLPETEDDNVALASWGLERVGVATKSGTGKDVHIYVLDTGIRASHSDFGGRVIPTLDMTSGSAVECDGSTSCAGDRQGHGSHCAGTAGGMQYGIATDATIHAVKVLSDRGSGEWSWSYDALDFLAVNGEFPAVASMSLGGEGALEAMAVAVNTAVDAGVVVVVAAGNSNSDACDFSPAFVPAAITVGSTTESDARSGFSNFGACVDIWAPGSNIVSVGIFSDTARRSLSGTSMACPHVSGGAALILEANPTMEASVVVDALLGNSEVGALTGLKDTDSNNLLWVSSDPAPVPAPTPAPDAPDNCPAYCSLCILAICRENCSFC